MPPLVSIIVISKDDEPGLLVTLTSIAEQDYDDAEVVLIVKGGSERVDLARFALPRVRRVIQRGTGISDAFNQGLEHARGRWVNFLNGGDSYRGPDVLNSLDPVLRDGGYSMVAGRAQDLRTGVMIPRDRSFNSRDIELVSHQATFFDRQLFAVHGRYSPMFQVRMDFEWMLRMPPDTAVVWLDCSIVNFEGQGVSSTQPWRSCREELQALRLHGRGAIRIARLLLVTLPFRLLRAQLRRILT
jgi:putative colanic acid biosynthesis glycosyltransferase